jgi:hypothetical protein
MSTLKTINLVHPTSATNNIVLDASGNMTAGGTMAMSSSFMRNRIINGAMTIDQRNAGASVTLTASAYTLDRWRAEVSPGTGGAYSVQRSSLAPVGFTNSALITVTTADSSIASTDYYDIQQFVEGFNIADLGWGTANAQTITVSFWVRSSVTGTFAGSIGNSAANRSYVFTYSIAAANTFEYKTITIPGDTSGTWLTDNGRGILLTFDLGNGSSYQASAGAWVAQYAVGTASSVKLISTAGATFYITGVQLEVGTVATPFERRLYGTEWMLCQRYCQKFDVFPEASFDAFMTYFGGSLALSSVKRLTTTMRASPTASFANAGIEYYSYAGVWTATTLAAVIRSAEMYYIYCAADGDGRGKLVRCGSAGAAPNPVVTFSAEL